MAQLVAYSDAGVLLSRIAPHLPLSVNELADLLLAYRVGALARLGAGAGVDLLQDRDGACLIGGCGRPLHERRLCEPHYRRFRTGRTLLATPWNATAVVRTCIECGVTWCPVVPGAARHLLCGSPACRRAAWRRGGRRAADTKRQDERNAAILDRVRAGERYASIAADLGLSRGRIGQLANRAGIYRRAAATERSRAVRRRRRARNGVPED